MSVLGVTLATRAALATAITAGGLKCYKYDTWDIAEGNVATLGLARWLVSENMDQAYGFHDIVLPVLVYQVVDASIDDALGYQESNVEKVINGLSRDRTLGNAVASSEVSDEITQEYYRADTGAEYSLVTFSVQVTPHPNMAS